MMDFSKPRHGRISEKILKGSQANEPEKDFNRKDAFGSVHHLLFPQY